MTTTTGATVPRPSSERASSTSDHVRPVELPDLVACDGDVVALRRRPVLAHGGLADRDEAIGERLVGARSASDRHWWIPAAAVWTDGDSAGRPEHPRDVGLATDRSWSRAALTGLSDRLGWEARTARTGGADLPRLDGLLPETSAVFDGRLGHDVPTVLIESTHVVRWGCGTTVDAAVRRALFGDQGTADDAAARELADLELILAGSDLGVVVVDLATALIRAAGVARVSVQLTVSSHDSVRRWDGVPIQ